MAFVQLTPGPQVPIVSPTYTLPIVDAPRG
jgi:hypothetical protein